MNHFTKSVRVELTRARNRYPSSIHSAHEGIAIVEEEFLEARQEVFHGDNPQSLYKELVQLAAMCQRMAEDIEL